jgi:hypothetical protein
MPQNRKPGPEKRRPWRRVLGHAFRHDDGTLPLMPDHPVNLTPTGPPETQLPSEPEEVRRAVAEAGGRAPADRKRALSDVVARWPRSLDAWARLGEATEEPVEAYAYFRIGYHRGLDALRGAGWRGSGYVRWSQESNRGFLRALRGLGRAAARIGEQDEVERIDAFLAQLDPDWDGTGD